MSKSRHENRIYQILFVFFTAFFAIGFCLFGSSTNQLNAYSEENHDFITINENDGENAITENQIWRSKTNKSEFFINVANQELKVTFSPLLTVFGHNTQLKGISLKLTKEVEFGDDLNVFYQIVRKVDLDGSIKYIIYDGLESSSSYVDITSGLLVGREILKHSSLNNVIFNIKNEGWTDPRYGKPFYVKIASMLAGVQAGGNIALTNVPNITLDDSKELWALIELRFAELDVAQWMSFGTKLITYDDGALAVGLKLIASNSLGGRDAYFQILYKSTNDVITYLGINANVDNYLTTKISSPINAGAFTGYTIDINDTKVKLRSLFRATLAGYWTTATKQHAKVLYESLSENFVATTTILDNGWVYESSGTKTNDDDPYDYVVFAKNFIDTNALIDSDPISAKLKLFRSGINIGKANVYYSYFGGTVNVTEYGEENVNIKVYGNIELIDKWIKISMTIKAMILDGWTIESNSANVWNLEKTLGGYVFRVKINGPQGSTEDSGNYKIILRTTQSESTYAVVDSDVDLTHDFAVFTTVDAINQHINIKLIELIDNRITMPSLLINSNSEDGWSNKDASENGFITYTKTVNRRSFNNEEENSDNLILKLITTGDDIGKIVVYKEGADVPSILSESSMEATEIWTMSALLTTPEAGWSAVPDEVGLYTKQFYTTNVSVFLKFEMVAIGTYTDNFKIYVFQNDEFDHSGDDDTKAFVPYSIGTDATDIHTEFDSDLTIKKISIMLIVQAFNADNSWDNVSPTAYTMLFSKTISDLDFFIALKLADTSHSSYGSVKIYNTTRFRRGKKGFFGSVINNQILASNPIDVVEKFIENYIPSGLMILKITTDFDWTSVTSDNDKYYEKTFASPDVDASNIKFFIRLKAIRLNMINPDKFELYTTINNLFDGKKTYTLSGDERSKLFAITSNGEKYELDRANLLVSADYTNDKIDVIIEMYLNDRYLTRNGWTTPTTDSEHLIYTKTVRGHDFHLKLKSSGEDVNKYKIVVATALVDVHANLETDLTNTKTDELITAWFTTKISGIITELTNSNISWVESESAADPDDPYIFSQEKIGITFELKLFWSGPKTGKFKIFSKDVDDNNRKVYYDINGLAVDSSDSTFYAYGDEIDAAATIGIINKAALIAISDSLIGWTAAPENDDHPTLNTYTKSEYTLTVKKTTRDATRIKLFVTSDTDDESIIVPENTAWIDYSTSVTTPLEVWAARASIVSALTESTRVWSRPDQVNKPDTYEKTYSGKSFFIDIIVTEENTVKYTIYKTADVTVDGTKTYLTADGSTNTTEQLISFTNITAIDMLIADHLVTLINTELLNESPTTFNSVQWVSGTDTADNKVYTATIYTTEFTLHLEIATGKIKVFKTNNTINNTISYVTGLGSSSAYVDYYSPPNNLKTKLSKWNSLLIYDIKMALINEENPFSVVDDAADPTVYIRTKNGHTFTLNLVITGTNIRKIKIATDESDEHLLLTSSDTYVTFINLATINAAIDNWLAARITLIDTVLTTNDWTSDITGNSSSTNTYTKTINSIEFTITFKKIGRNAESIKLTANYNNAVFDIGFKFTSWVNYATSVTTPIATWVAEINKTVLDKIEKILVTTNSWVADDGNLDHETLNTYTKEINDIEYTLTVKKTTADATKIQITTIYEFIIVDVVDVNTTWIDYTTSAFTPIEVWVNDKLSPITTALTGSSTAWTLTNPQTPHTYEKTYSGKKFFIDITASGNDLGKYTIYTTSNDVQSSTKNHLTTSGATSAAEQLISFNNITAIDMLIADHLVTLINTELLATSATEFKPDGAWDPQTHENLYKVFASTIYGNSFTLHLEIATGKIKVFETADFRTYLLGSSSAYADYYDATNNIKTQLLAWNNKKITAIDAALVDINSGQNNWVRVTNAIDTEPTTNTYTKTVQGITFRLVLTTEGENSRKFQIWVTAFGTTSSIYSSDTENNNHNINDFQTDLDTIPNAINNWIATKMTAIKTEITNAVVIPGDNDNTAWTTNKRTNPYVYTKMQSDYTFTLTLITEGDDTGKFSVQHDSDTPVYLLESADSTFVEYTNIAAINSAVTSQVATLTKDASDVALANTAILTADDAWIAGNPIAATDSNLGYTDLTKTYTPSAGSSETYNFKIKLLTNGEFSLFFDHASADDIYLNSDGQSTLSSSTDHVISESSVSDINDLLEIWTVSYAATEALKSKLLVGSAWTLVDNTNDPLAKIYYTKTFSDPSDAAVKFFIAIEKTGINAGKFKLYTSDTYDIISATNLFLINAVTGAKETLDDADLLVGADYSADQIATIINMYLNDRYLLSNDWTSSSTDFTHLIYTKTVRGHEFTLKLESSSDNVNKYKLEVAGNVFSISFETDFSNTKTDELILAWFTSEISNINAAIEATAWSTKTSTTDDLYVFTLARAGIDFSLELTVTGDDTGKFTLSSPASGIKTFYNIEGTSSVSKVAIAYTETDNAAATILAINSAAVRAIDEILTSPSNNSWTVAEGNDENSMLNTYTNTIDDIDYTLTVKKTTADATKIKLLATLDPDHESIVAPENTVWVDYNTSVTTPIEVWVTHTKIVFALTESTIAWSQLDQANKPNSYKKNYSGMSFFIDVIVTRENIGKYTIYTTTDGTINETKTYLTTTAGVTNTAEQFISFTDIIAVDTMIANHLVVLINTELLDASPTVFNPVQWVSETDTVNDKVYTATIYTTEFTLHLEIATGKIKLFHPDDSKALIYLLGSTSNYDDYYDATDNVKTKLNAWNTATINVIKTALTGSANTNLWTTSDVTSVPIVYRFDKNTHTFTLKLYTSLANSGKISVASDSMPSTYLIGGVDAADSTNFDNIAKIDRVINMWLGEQIAAIVTDLKSNSLWGDERTDDSTDTKTLTKTVFGTEFTLVLNTAGKNTEKFHVYTNDYGDGATKSYVIGDESTYHDNSVSTADFAIETWIDSNKIATTILGISLALSEIEWTSTPMKEDDSTHLFTKIYGNYVLTIEYDAENSANTFQIFQYETEILPPTAPGAVFVSTATTQTYVDLDDINALITDWFLVTDVIDANIATLTASGWSAPTIDNGIKTLTKIYIDSNSATNITFAIKIHLDGNNAGKIWVVKIVSFVETAVIGSNSAPINFIPAATLNQTIELFLISAALKQTMSRWVATSDEGSLKVFTQTVDGKEFTLKLQSDMIATNFKKIKLYVDLYTTASAASLLSDNDLTELSTGWTDYTTNAATIEQINEWLAAQIAAINTKLLATEAGWFAINNAIDIDDSYMYTYNKNGHTFTINLKVHGDHAAKFNIATDDSSSSYLLDSAADIYIDFVDLSIINDAVDVWLAKRITLIDMALIGINADQYSWTKTSTDTTSVVNTISYTKVFQGITFNLVLTTSGDNASNFKLAVTFGGATVYPFNTTGSTYNEKYDDDEFQTDLDMISGAITDWIAAKLSAIETEISTNGWVKVTDVSTEMIVSFTKKGCSNIFYLMLHTSGDKTGKYSLHYTIKTDTSVQPDSMNPVATYLLATGLDTFIEYTDIATINTAVNKIIDCPIYQFIDLLTETNEWTDTTSEAGTRIFKKAVSGTEFTVVIYTVGENKKKFQIYTNDVGDGTTNYHLIGDDATYQELASDLSNSAISVIKTETIQAWIDNQKTATNILGISLTALSTDWTKVKMHDISNVHTYKKLFGGIYIITLQYVDLGSGETDANKFQLFQIETALIPTTNSLVEVSSAINELTTYSIFSDIETMIIEWLNTTGSDGWTAGNHEINGEKIFTKDYFDSNVDADKTFTLRINSLTNKIYVETMIDSVATAVIASADLPIDPIISDELDQKIQLFLITTAINLEDSGWTFSSDFGSLEVYTKIADGKTFKLKIETSFSDANSNKIKLYVDLRAITPVATLSTHDSLTELSVGWIEYTSNEMMDDRINSWFDDRVTAIKDELATLDQTWIPFEKNDYPNSYVNTIVDKKLFLQIITTGVFNAQYTLFKTDDDTPTGNPSYFNAATLTLDSDEVYYEFSDLKTLSTQTASYYKKIDRIPLAIELEGWVKAINSVPGFELYTKVILGQEFTFKLGLSGKNTDKYQLYIDNSNSHDSDSRNVFLPSADWFVWTNYEAITTKINNWNDAEIATIELWLITTRPADSDYKTDNDWSIWTADSNNTADRNQNIYTQTLANYTFTLTLQTLGDDARKFLVSAVHEGGNITENPYGADSGPQKDFSALYIKLDEWLATKVRSDTHMIALVIGIAVIVLLSGFLFVRIYRHIGFFR